MAPTAAIMSDFVIYNRRLRVLLSACAHRTPMSIATGGEGLVGFQPDMGGEGVGR